jgi:hypothetical protein
LEHAAFTATSVTIPHTDFTRAFTPGLRITRPGDTFELDVEHLGALDIGPRGLWVFDPGYPVVDPPFALPAGRYRVDLGVTSPPRLTTAMRVALPDAAVVEWRDVGTVACDGGSVAVASTPEQAAALTTRAGFGDGGYGCFLGLDAHGTAVAFVVDFFVLVGPDDVRLALSPEVRGRVVDPRLDDAGLVLTATDDGFSLDATAKVSADVTDFALMVFDANGQQMICNSSAQAGRWWWERPHPSLRRLELWFQRGVIAY